MSSDDRWAKATAAVERIEEVESVRRDPAAAQADLTALRRAAVRVTGCDVDADLSVLLAALALLPSFEERVGAVQLLRDAAGGALSPEDTAAVLAVLSRSVPAGEAPRPATAPLAQALDLLRRTRAVLHKLDPAHELLRAEIDALLAGTPKANASLGTCECGEPATARVGFNGAPLTPACTDTVSARQKASASRPEPRAHAALDPEDVRALVVALQTNGASGALVGEAQSLLVRARAAHRRPEPTRAPEHVKETLSTSDRPAPLTEEEARIARDLQACAAAWEPDVRLICNLTAREIGRFASAILSRGEIPPDVRPVSASSAGEWQCVSCHAHETEMHRAWCEIEGAAGTVAIKSTPHTHPPTAPEKG